MDDHVAVVHKALRVDEATAVLVLHHPTFALGMASEKLALKHKATRTLVVAIGAVESEIRAGGDVGTAPLELRGKGNGRHFGLGVCVPVSSEYMKRRKRFT